MPKDIWREARKGKLDKVKKYIPSKIKVDEVDKENKTPLHHAIEGDQLQVVHYLIENGAKINLKDPKGDTPILMSVRRIVINEIQEDIAILLINKGCDLEIESRERKSVDRYVEGTSKRFQIRYKEALQQRFRAAHTPKPGTTPAAPKPQQQPQQPHPSSPAPSTQSISVSQPPTPTTPSPIPQQHQTSTPTSSSSQPTIHTGGSGNIPTALLTTVQQKPVTTNGVTFIKPAQLDIVPKTLLGEEFTHVKDLNLIWLEVAYRVSIVAVCSEKIRYDDISKAIDNCGNMLVHLLSIIGDSETTSFMENSRNQDAVNAIQERVKNVRDGVKLRLFSRIEHSEVIRLVAALVGSLHWLYYCWSEISQDDINRSIAECALACRTAMNSVTSLTAVPHILTNIVKLAKNVSIRSFITRNPDTAKKMSDALYTIGGTFKSLMVLSVLNDKDLERSPENIIALGRGIAEQLSSLKNVTSSLAPSKIGSPLSSEVEKDLSEGASKQLRGSIDFYKSNQPRLKLPSEELVIPFLSSIQKSMSILSNYCTLEKDLQLIVPAQMIAQDLNELRQIFKTFQSGYAIENNLSEELIDQITTSIDCSCHFATQLLFAVAAIACHNRITDFSQIGYSVRDSHHKRCENDQQQQNQTCHNPQTTYSASLSVVVPVLKTFHQNDHHHHQPSFDCHTHSNYDNSHYHHETSNYHSSHYNDHGSHYDSNDHCSSSHHSYD
eukprot:gene4626-5778_t